MMALFGFLIRPLAGLLVKRSLASGGGLTQSGGERLAKIIVIAGLVLLAIGGAALWLHLHDKGVIEQHDTERQLGEAKTALESRDRADTAGKTRDDARSADDQTTRDELETIHAEDPDAAAKPAGRGQRAVADRLRP